MSDFEEQLSQSICLTRGQCYKITAVNFYGNFNPTFKGLKWQFKTAILG